MFLCVKRSTMRLVLSFVLVWAIAYAKPSARGLDLARLTRSRYDKIDAAGCGQRPLASGNGASEVALRIVGGQETIPYSHPSICSLRYTTAPTHHFCGGTLVKNLAGEYYFVTAAHCVYGEPRASRYEAHCGIHDRSDLREPHRVIVHFSALTSHPLYDDWTIDYDIAIFKVSTALPTNNYISAVCIPNEGWFEGEKGLVAGWGTLTSGGDSPYKLHQVQKPIKSRATCEQRYGAGSITLRMLCAGLPQGGVDSCQGDSGGPLYTLRENRWTLTGIVSWGYGCAEAGRPGVYADVIELKDWINTVINRL
ncbi:serine protease beta [Biomphalaria pfeifferi]|uniref:Serine protease beta n=1 Tax=Biomphalaria pfeifferi TaxID=112525 RepID=A0AAD8B8Z9_BIOPF|nr:serine protease beta [Biomphalaria pfeifferi]